MEHTQVEINRSRKLTIRQRSQRDRDWSKICSDLINYGIAPENAILASLSTSLTHRWDQTTQALYLEISRRFRLILSDSAPGLRPGSHLLPRSMAQREAAAGRAVAAPAALLPEPSPCIELPALLPRHRRSELTRDSLAALLAFLDPEPECAGQQYVRLHAKLTRFFQGRGCGTAAELADETLNRAGIRLARGEQIRDLTRYLYGVARNVLHEFQIHREKCFLRLEELSPGEHPRVIPEALKELSEAEERTEKILVCLEQCLGEMAADSRNLLLEYYLDERRARIEHRKLMAIRLGITLSALRIRVWRIREALEREVSNRLFLSTGD
jgi:DNA-directed RNA polymerase specialized sigma24 family protein